MMSDNVFMKHACFAILLSSACLLFSCDQKRKTTELPEINEEVASDAAVTVSAPQTEEPVDREAFYRDFREFDKFDDGKERMADDFSGEYTITYGSGSKFSLTLNQTGSTVRGSYCGYSATRNDCGLESQGVPDCPVKGSIFGDICYVSFISCYNGTKGVAKLHKKGNDIFWTTIESPPSGSESGYFSGPDTGLLVKLFKPMNEEHAFSNLGSEFNLSGNVDPGPRKLFNNVAIYQTQQLEEVIFDLKAGDSIYIEEPATRYIFTREGDVELLLPAYKIKYNDKTGYVKGQDIPMNNFTDGEGTHFLIGMDSEDEKLKLKIFRSDSLIDQKELFRIVYTMSDFKDYYVELNFKFDYLKDIKAQGLSFFQFHYAHTGSGGYSGLEYYFWNGSTMERLQVNDKIEEGIISEELEFLKGNDNAPDTVVYKVATADIDYQTGDYANEENTSYYFINGGGNLIQVDKRSDE